MKKVILLPVIAAVVLVSSCINGQNQHSKSNLDAPAFAEKISQTPDAILIDVRTPEEFLKGHLENALNYNWNGDDFQSQVSKLDKSKPVFLYCLSGGRSSSAARQMRSDGFKDLYELNGGIMKWRAANLPETSNARILSSGMTRQQFDELLYSGKLVLIDFYADWCEPCKKMKPFLEELSKEYAEKLIVFRINADDNQSLCKALKIDALPVLQLYKNKLLTWTNTGFISKESIVEKLK